MYTNRMFDFKTSLNSLGILLTLGGVYMVYKNSPLNEHQIDGGRPDTDFDKIAHVAKRKNDGSRLGDLRV